MENFDELANAIVLQARRDLIDAYVKEHKAKLMLDEAGRVKSEVATFLSSDYYRTLTDVLPEVIIKTAQQEAEFVEYRNRRHCRSCKLTEKQCKWRNADNWKSWTDAKLKTCPKANQWHIQNQKGEEK